MNAEANDTSFDQITQENTRHRNGQELLWTNQIGPLRVVVYSSIPAYKRETNILFYNLLQKDTLTEVGKKEASHSPSKHMQLVYSFPLIPEAGWMGLSCGRCKGQEHFTSWEVGVTVFDPGINLGGRINIE